MAIPFTYHAKAQSTFKPPLIANENAFLGDVISRYVLSHCILGEYLDPAEQMQMQIHIRTHSLTLLFSAATRIMPTSQSPAASIVWKKVPRWSIPIPTMK
jgi:hypothetical protein